VLTALEQLGPHDHLCSIYESSEEHFAVAIPFIRIGLDRGEKCIYIADDATEAVVRDAMSAEASTSNGPSRPTAWCWRRRSRVSETRIL